MSPDVGPNTTEIGRLIDRIKAGQPGARMELFEKCYRQFVMIARKMMNSPDFKGVRKRGVESADVVHEAVLERIFKENKSGKDLLARQDFDDPKEFIGAVANHIRFCLKDIVRGRGDAAIRQAKQNSNPPSSGGRQAQDKLQAPNVPRLALLDEALDELDGMEQEVIKHRYLMGLSREETAATLGVSTKTVTRHARQGLEKIGNRLEAPVSLQ